MRVRLETARGKRLWRGSFIAFARANALQAGEMYTLKERLERVSFDGGRWGKTLRRE